MTALNTHRLLRGGSWGFNPRYCRSVRRIPARPGEAGDVIGFRVVCLHPPRMVVRGGSWSLFPRCCRSTDRDHCRITAGATSLLVGFRVVCLPREVAP
jgi:formylglycine-generating enzyme required for sulfatase activity